MHWLYVLYVALQGMDVMHVMHVGNLCSEQGCLCLVYVVMVMYVIHIMHVIHVCSAPDEVLYVDDQIKPWPWNFPTHGPCQCRCSGRGFVEVLGIWHRDLGIWFKLSSWAWIWILCPPTLSNASTVCKLCNSSMNVCVYAWLFVYLPSMYSIQLI